MQEDLDLYLSQGGLEIAPNSFQGWSDKRINIILRYLIMPEFSSKIKGWKDLDIQEHQTLTLEEIKEYLLEIFKTRKGDPNIPLIRTMGSIQDEIDVEVLKREETWKNIISIQESDWYKERPRCIQEVVNLKSPDRWYSLNGKQCWIYSYEEPKSNLLEDVTVTVVKTGNSKTPQMIPQQNSVFGVKLDDLEEW